MRRRLEGGMEKNMNICIIYKSKYGHTENYANWIYERLTSNTHNVEIYTLKESEKVDLKTYDLIIYGAGIYASTIAGLKSTAARFEKLLSKHSHTKLIIFTVGLFPQIEDNKSGFIIGRLSEGMQVFQGERLECFHFQGGMDFQKLKTGDKMLMSVVKKYTEKKLEINLTDEDKILLKSYKEKINLSDKEKIEPLISYVNSIK